MAAYADGRTTTGRATVAGHRRGDAVAVASRWWRGGGGPGKAGNSRHWAARADVRQVLGQKQCIRPRPPRHPHGPAQTGAVASWPVGAGALAATASPLIVALTR